MSEVMPHAISPVDPFRPQLRANIDGTFSLDLYIRRLKHNGLCLILMLLLPSPTPKA